MISSMLHKLEIQRTDCHNHRGFSSSGSAPFHKDPLLNEKLKLRFKSYMWWDKTSTAVPMYSDDFEKSASDRGWVITNNLHSCVLQMKVIGEML